MYLLSDDEEGRGSPRRKERHHSEENMAAALRSRLKRKRYCSRPRKQKKKNLGYKGVTCKDVDEDIAEVEGPMTAEAFWKCFVLPRRPCVLRNYGTWGGMMSKSSKDWCKELCDIAGDETVRVETKVEGSRAFGLGRDRTLRLKDFLKHLSRTKESSYYMSTQTLAEDDEARLK